MDLDKDDELQLYVNSPDLYTNTPLLNACAKNYEKIENHRP